VRRQRIENGRRRKKIRNGGRRATVDDCGTIRGAGETPLELERWVGLPGSGGDGRAAARAAAAFSCS